MTNEEFWRKLDQLTPTGSDPDNIRRFAQVLKQGYEQDLDLLVTGKLQGDQFNQAYIMSPHGRVLLCFTSDMHAAAFRAYGYDGYPAVCCLVKVRIIMNNMFNKESIAGLVFNPRDANHATAVPKFLLEQIMPGPRLKPEKKVAP